MIEPGVKQIGEELWFKWDDSQIMMEFSHWRDNSEGAAADVKIHQLSTAASYWGRVSLASPQSRANLVKGAAADLDPGIPWVQMVNIACQRAMDHLRAGSPAEQLEPAPHTDEQWLLPKWVPAKETTVLFGDGGAGKSLLALALTASSLSGLRLGSWVPGPSVCALYLDWESTKAEVNGRLWGLAEYLDRLSLPVPIHYRRMMRPLTDELSGVRKDVARLKVDLVICDSLGPACGAEPESADAAVRAMNALRSLPATRLVIAHMSKQAADQERGSARPFGSVYVQNLARSVIEVRGHQDGDTLDVSCYHRKVNAGARAKAVGFRFAFDSEGHITVRGHDADLSRAGIPAQILDNLKAGPKTGTTLAELIDADHGSIHRALSRMANRDIVALTGTKGGRSKETLWGLRLKTETRTGTNRDN